MTNKQIRVSKELENIIDKFHYKLQNQMGNGVKINRSVTTTAMAKSLENMGFPDNVDIFAVKMPLKKRQGWNFDFKI